MVPELLLQLVIEQLHLDLSMCPSVRSHDMAVEVPRSNLVSHKRYLVPSTAHICNSCRKSFPHLKNGTASKRRL